MGTGTASKCVDYFLQKKLKQGLAGRMEGESRLHLELGRNQETPCFPGNVGATRAGKGNQLRPGQPGERQRPEAADVCILEHLTKQKSLKTVRHTFTLSKVWVIG